MTAAQQSLVTTLNKSGGIPFIDMGGKYMISGATYDPGVLKGNTHAQIAAALSDPNSAIAKGADGSANVITAALGVVMVLYLIWIELFRVNAICLWCTGVHIATIALLAVILWHASVLRATTAGTT